MDERSRITTIRSEMFYEENLKGKSVVEMARFIRSLKQHINRLKDRMEHPDYGRDLCLQLNSVFIHQTSET